MFQNISEDKKINIKSGKSNIFSNVISKENIAIYVVALLISMVGIWQNLNFSIFSLSMLGACLATSIPVLGVVIVSVIGNAIKFGISGSLEYIFTTIILVLSLFVIKPRYNEEEKNEKIKIGKNIFIANILTQLFKIIITQFTIYDILVAITASVVAVVFYKIFVNSVDVIQDFYEKRAFSIEEVIGASLMVSIAVSGIGSLNIYEISIRNVISILIVMILGWQNGILIGTTSGVTIGITLGIITSSEPIMIAAYAVSGMIAGILNKFGKIGVIVGFIIGNVLLAYVTNGNTFELIHLREILIASIGLLAIPKTLKIDIEDFEGNSKLLPLSSDRTLDKSKEVAENLNNVSNAIDKIADTYKSDENTLISKNKINLDKNKNIFITELLNNLEPYKKNILYDDISKADGEIDNQIFNLLLEKQEINKKDLLEIFAKCNSYIVDADDEHISKKLNDDIMLIVRTINVSYKVAKSNFIWKKRQEETKKNMEKQLKGVSSAIKNMANGIEKDIKDEEQFKDEKIKIVKLLKQNDIDILDLNIKQKNRYIVEIFLNEEIDENKKERISKILTKTLDEQIVLNENAENSKKLVYISADKYKMKIGIAKKNKDKSTESGDSILNIRLKDGKYLIAISDGMGSGIKAKKSSQQALNLLKDLLISGFDKKTSIELINNALIGQNKETFATLDIAIVDLYCGNVEFIKSAACPTYIKKNKKVQMIKSASLPTGILSQSKIESFDRDISKNEIIVLCSDGILDANVEYKNKELWVKYLLEDIETTDTKKISDLILKEAIDNNYGKAKDDMSVITFKFLENHK